MNETIDFTNNCTDLGGTFNGTNCTQVMLSQQKIRSVCVIFISIQFDDPFYMPTWRKYLWSIFFFVMVATADIGNIIGNECFIQKSPVVIHRLHCVRVMDVKGEVITWLTAPGSTFPCHCFTFSVLCKTATEVYYLNECKLYPKVNLFFQWYGLWCLMQGWDQSPTTSLWISQ